ncbi:MAG: signal transduction histidine kinase, LytS [Clostridiales bacterium]|jgi:sensor histidine kinase YesM|nr:signal transduction histidine kinase, LytS [Clostridiales bacterium]
MSKRKGVIFKDKIKRAFMLYALIPIIFSIVLINLSVIFLSYSIAKRSTRESSIAISNNIENQFLEYIAKGQELGDSPEIKSLILNSTYKEIYPEVYLFMNNNDFKSKFYVFDAEANLITGSRLNLPGYLENIEEPLSWGIFKQMKNDFGRTVMQKNISVSRYGESTIYSIGNAVIEDEKIIGYVIFDIYEESFKNNLVNYPDTIVALTDGYDNIVYSTNALLVKQNGKLKNEIREITDEGIKSNKYTVYKQEIFDGKLKVYSIAIRGDLNSALEITNIFGGIMILIIFVSMTFMSEKIAKTNSGGLMELANAFEKMKQGDFDTKINLTSTLEFESISQVYNSTLDDIKRLMAENEERATRNVMSELQALEAQFNPHFLFNTLETLRYTIDLDTVAAKNIIKLLANILRYSINQDYQVVMFGQDLEFIKCYLEIQSCRFKDKFKYNLKIDYKTESCILPKLIIQPLIENAIKYGFVGKTELIVEIKASIINGNLVIIITDSGIGINEKKLSELRLIINQENNLSAHIGLHNVQRRIKLTYGPEYGIEINSKYQEGTKLKIVIPERHF